MLNVMLLLPLSICLWLNLGVALRNITVDDQSPLIHYSPPLEWITMEDTLDAGGGHMLTNFIGAEATITFSFVNMYYMSTRWAYHVGAAIVVDGQAGIADMQDYTAPPNLDTKRATTQSSVVWSYKGDGMKERIVTVKVPRGDTLTVVDMFIFEVDDQATTLVQGSTPAPGPSSVLSGTSSTPTPSPSSLSTSLPSPTPSFLLTDSTSHGLSGQSKALVISLSIIGAALLALVLFFMYWVLVRKPSKKEDEIEKVEAVDEKKPAEPEVDGKAQDSPRASLGQASNSPSSDDEEPKQPEPLNQTIYTPSTTTAPPPERRPTIIVHAIPANLHRNPTSVSIQHGLDIPSVPRNRGQSSSDPTASSDPEMGMDDD